MLQSPDRIIRNGTNLEKVFAIQTDNGWVNGCKNASFEYLKNEEFDVKFTTLSDNSCHHLKRSQVDGTSQFVAQFVLSGTNKIPGAPITIGRMIRYDFSCPLEGAVLKKSGFEDVKRAKSRQQLMFVGAIFALMLAFVCIHLRIQKRHREEMSMLKNKVF